VLCDTYARMSYFTSTYSFVVIILCFLTGGCSQRALREAQETVHQADSLWHAGQMYDDSAALAQTYETLDAWQYFYAEDYAHACYHYGKLLRTKEDPVSAMQAFIHATHSRTRDYHILGRIYNNMGAICHLAGEFPLSYEMFEKSSEMYRRNDDTLLYCYALNDMAFELAEQGKKDSVLLLVKAVEESCTNNQILLKTLETKAELYLKIGVADSAIYFARQSELFGVRSLPSITLIKAQAFARLERRDSALYYAKLVLSNQQTCYQDRFNALYFVSHFDSTLCSEDIRSVASQREDIRYYEHEPLMEKLADAILLLEQDINRKPDFKWLYAIIVTIAFAGAGISTHTYRKRRQHQLLSQKVNDLTQKNAFALQQHEQIVHEHTDYKNMLLSQLEYNCSVFTQSDTFPNNLNWKDFDAMCVVIDNNFNMLVAKLRHEHILSEKEMRLCILVVMNISRPKIAELLPYAASGIGKFKDQTAKKIGTSGKKMRTYLLEMAVGD